MEVNPDRLSLIIALFFAGLAYLWGRSLKIRQSPWPITVIYVLAGWPLAVNLANPRVIMYDQYAVFGTLETAAWSSAQQLSAWTITSLLVVYLVKRLLATKRAGVTPAGAGLLCSFLLFSSAAILSGLFGDPGGGLSHALLRPHIVFSCVYFAVNEQPSRVLRAAKWGCLAYVGGSLLAALITPQWAFSESAAISGGPLPIPRLYGVASNPNALAPIALMLIYLEYHLPSRTVPRLAGVLAALAVIVLAQSKTIWFAAAFGGAVLLYGAAKSRARAGRTAPFRRAALGAFIVALLAFAVVNVDSGTEMFRNTSLTGRTALWGVALEEWRAKPLMGYGPTLWDERFRREKLGSEAVFAGHAHNMYIQQLAESGSVGFLLMLVFLVTLAMVASRAKTASRGLSIALLSYVLLRCITESALSLRAIDESMFAGAAVFALFVVFASPSTRRRLPSGAVLPGSAMYRLRGDVPSVSSNQ